MHGHVFIHLSSFMPLYTFHKSHCHFLPSPQMCFYLSLHLFQGISHTFKLWIPSQVKKIFPYLKLPITLGGGVPPLGCGHATFEMNLGSSLIFLHIKWRTLLRVGVRWEDSGWRTQEMMRLGTAGAEVLEWLFFGDQEGKGNLENVEGDDEEDESNCYLSSN